MKIWLVIAMSACCIAAGSSDTSFADDRPLIWEPVKNSDTSYSLKAGMKLDFELEPKVGFDLGWEATDTGALVDTPISFWTTVKAVEIIRPNKRARSDLSFNVDAATGNAAMTMNLNKKITVSHFDIEREAAVAVRYDGSQQEWVGTDINRSVKVSPVGTGLALTASRSGTAGLDNMSAMIGWENRMSDRLTLSGDMRRNSAEPEAVGSIRARYFYRW